MPFTPKFVDLVRNATSVTGTGPVTLGAAVSGYTGLAAAVAANEQFYYCIQGVDKPQEREVGRGTMQANGTIAREAVSGTLTSFTSGAKTISLVAAAEWFSRLNALPSGVNGGVGSSAGFAALFAAASGMAIGAGIMRIKTDGHTVAGVGGAEYIHDAAINAGNVGVGGNVGTAFLAADGRGFRLDPSQRLTFDMFGAVPGDYATGVSADCLPAWTTLQNWIENNRRNVSASFQAAAPEINFPGNQYYFSARITIAKTVRLRGMGMGQGGGEPTWLRFPANSGGILVTQDANHTGAGSVIEGFLLQGGQGSLSGTVATDLLKSGIRLLQRAVIRDCTVRNFAGAGICISAAVGGGGGDYTGNANNWYVSTCRLDSNATGGIYVSGGDANAGVGIAIDASNNGRFGIWDGSFLGNSWIGCHTDNNGPGLALGNTQVCATYLGGSFWYPVYTASTATLQATTPGTNEAVWRKLAVAGAATAAAPAWSGSINIVTGGAYGGGAGFSVFSGCYYEGGQAPPQVAGLVVGGFMGQDADPGGTGLTPSARGLSCRQGFTVPKSFDDASVMDVSFGGAYDSANARLPLISWNSSQATAGFDPGRRFSFALDKASGDIVSIDLGIRFTTGVTQRLYGADTALAGKVFEVNKIALGNGDAARVRTLGGAAPASGAHGRGELVYNDGSVTSLKQVAYWLCTTAGTPGTWVGATPGLMVTLSQAAYDALATKDADTYYFVTA